MLPKFDISWTLFLDRDGVLNRKIENGYVLNPSMLDVAPGVPRAMATLGRHFGSIVIVTNQRGIGRGLMTPHDLERVHCRLLEDIGREGGKIDAIFVCPHDLQDECDCRKPKIGLALKAKIRFPTIEFSRSILVGDSDSDIAMGKGLGMFTVRIGPRASDTAGEMAFSDLLEFAKFLERAAV